MSYSTTTWIAELERGNAAAAQQLFEQYFEQLARIADLKLRSITARHVDGEDVALSALQDFLVSAKTRGFPKLNDRLDLWKLILTITVRKASHVIRSERTQRRGGGRCVGTDVGERKTQAQATPSPAVVATLADLVETAMTSLESEQLRRIAKLRLAGYTVQEIARLVGCSRASAERKLVLVRSSFKRTFAD